ncbi:hypothetical protein SLEP1_g10881 [Rubroshorea leprosula]|uniref:Transposase n=1 Tax=Rubroshorea leprosula TaxID=152421 RepID=A0AAV5IFB4_9ROSI|nr:hypothetical protein SLEP1_g10881 [Rubroshorea leprosula]
MPTDGMKIPLELDDYGGLPQKVRRQIVVQLRENLPDAYTAWGQVLREHRDMYWNIFSQTYEWDPAIEKPVKDLWNMTARIKFKHALSELKAKCAKRNFQAKPPDMNPELWAKLVHLWTEDEGHLRRSSSAKANRAKGPRVTHTNDTMNVNVYRKKMQQANPEGRLPTYLKVYTSRRQHKGKGKDQLFVYCNDEAQEIEEKLTAECATRQEEEGFDPTILHGEILLRATGEVKKGWLKGLDIHTYPQDISVSTSRQEPFGPPIIGQSNRTTELEQTIESLKADNHSLRQTQMAL